MDEDRNPKWPADWQRHYAALRKLVRDEEGQADILPGFTVHGMDIGRWLNKQRQHATWTKLTARQRERLEAVGVIPPAPEPEAPAASGPQKALSAFERGVAALAQTRPAPAP